MKEADFINKYSSQWEDLKNLSLKIEGKGIKKLSSTEIQKFLYLFRQCSRHLAYARTYFPESKIVGYLNSQIGYSHNMAYAVKKFDTGGIAQYIFKGFPKLLKENRRFILLSFGIFLAGVLFSLIFTMINAGNANYFLPEDLIKNIKTATSGSSKEWNYPLMSSQIMVNNISIALRAFVLGITFGIGTVYILFYNGLVLGSLTALVYKYGNPLIYWSLILPHGIIELSAIFISGAAGLIIGYKMLIPKAYSRKHSLIAGAKQAVSLIFGIVLMLVVAAIIEGFFTPLSISPIIKLIFALSTAVLLCGYFLVPYVGKNKIS